MGEMCAVMHTRRTSRCDDSDDKGKGNVMSSRSRRPARDTSPEDDSRSPIIGFLPLIAAAVVVVAAGLWFGGLFPSSGSNSSGGLPPAVSHEPLSGGALPRFAVVAGDQSVEAYLYAVEAAEELEFIPCYCGCGEHDNHRNVRDCFVKQMAPDGVLYDEHGAGCEMCQTIVLDVKRLLAEGKTLTEARAFIDENYKDYGSPTDTPMPPAEVTAR